MYPCKRCGETNYDEFKYISGMIYTNCLECGLEVEFESRSKKRKKFKNNK